MRIGERTKLVRTLATGATALAIAFGVALACSDGAGATTISSVRLTEMSPTVSCVWPSWGVSSSNDPPTQLTQGEKLSYQFVAPKGPSGGTWVLVDSTLPSEFTLSASGLLSGTAETVGSFTYGVDYVGPGGSAPRDGFCGYNDQQVGYMLSVDPSTPVPVGAVGGLGFAVIAGGGFLLLQRRRRQPSAAAS